jgi:hypothetical protein
MKPSQHTIPSPLLTTLSDVMRWRSSLLQLHARLACYFARPEPYQRLLHFVQGVLSQVERKNGWQLAEHAREATPYGMQRLLSQAVWDEDGVRDEVRALALQQLGTSQAIVAVDETSFPKRGKHSAGVKKQYCGTTGHVENCQVGVFLSYITARGHTLIDRELYLPQDWLDDRARCQQAGIPDTIPFRTKPELALQMLERLHQARVPVEWVVADSVYGGYPDLRTWLETHQYPYVGAVACDEPVVLQMPAGVRRVEVRDVPALLLTDSSWQRLALSKGSKGPRLFDWACVPLLHRGADDGWHSLLIRRTLDAPAEQAYYLVFAPPATPLHIKVTALGGRWRIEIVQSQMTKTQMLTARGGGDHIADLHLLIGHDDAINQQLDQLSFLLKSGLSKPLLDSLAKGLNGLYHTCQFIVSSNTDFQLTCLFSNALLSLFQFVPASLVFFQRKHSSQIGVSQAFCLLSQADTRFAQILPASL